MILAGRYNTLGIIRQTSNGFYLNGENLGEILIPNKYIPQNKNIGDEIEVFVYYDAEGRLVATTEEPFCEVGDFAMLQIVDVNATGAFANWGVLKQLLIPFSEQKVKMQTGSWHIVHVYIDEKSKRIVGSAKVDKFLNKTPANYNSNEEVGLIVYSHTPLGYKVIINNAHWGMLYENEVFQPLNKGEYITGYISQVREDGKIDVSLYPLGHNKTDVSANLIMEYLQAHDGIMLITDKSDANLIYETFGISKKNFKMAIGKLYKNKQISIDDKQIKII